MAKKPEKKEEPAEGEGGDARAGGGKKKLFIMIGAGAAVLLLVGGGAAFFLMGGKKEDPHAAQGSAPHADPARQSLFVDLPDMMVNLSTADSRASFLKVKIALEISDKATEEKIKPVLPRVLDTFQLYLRELRSSDLDGSAGLYRVKEELQRRINVAIYPAKIDAVLFKEILVQ